MTDLFETEIDSGSKCGAGHPILLVAEGYAMCRSERGLSRAIRLTPPRTNLFHWYQFNIRSRTGERIPAWEWKPPGFTKAEVLAFIQADIDAHRNLPFDEEAERARLMPV